MTEAEALAQLQQAIRAATLTGLARKLGISPQYLNDVARGRRPPTLVLERFGLKRVVRYEKAQAYEEAQT